MVDVRKQLDAILETYDRKLKEKKEGIEKTKKEEETFLKEFKKTRSQVIRPVMEEMGRRLKERGHNYRIKEEEETQDSEGRTKDARITMDIYPSELDPVEYILEPGSTPTISFSAIRYKKKVAIYGSNIMPYRGGTGGPRGEFDISQINSDFVTQEILKMLQEIFSPT